MYINVEEMRSLAKAEYEKALAEAKRVYDGRLESIGWVAEHAKAVAIGPRPRKVADGEVQELLANIDNFLGPSKLDAVRRAVEAMPGEFNAAQLAGHPDAKGINPNTLGGSIRRLIKNGVIAVVPGTGKRNRRYRRL